MDPTTGALPNGTHLLAFTGAQTPHVGMRLVLRQGERITRTRTEITKALQTKLDAEKTAKQKKK